MIAAQAKFNGIAQRCAPNDLHVNSVAKAHLEQSSLHLAITPDGDNRTMAADSELVHGTSLNRPTVITARKIAGFIHYFAPSALDSIILTLRTHQIISR